MQILVATLVVLLLLCVGILLENRRQMKHICRQLSFRREHQTNLLLTHKTGIGFGKLIDLINDNLQKQEDIIRQYEQADAGLKETIADLSHDIRTPLTSLDGYFQLLQACPDEESKQRYYAVINGRISALREILEELFLYAKMQDSSFALAQETPDLAGLLVETSLGFYQDFKQKGITPELAMPKQPLYVCGDHSALIRVIQNLIRNALTHGEGCVRISLQQTDEAILTVSNRFDTSKETPDPARVFERFYKADRSRSFASTGLGMPIAKGLTERMGGQIAAQVQDGIFSVEVRLPLA